MADDVQRGDRRQLKPAGAPEEGYGIKVGVLPFRVCVLGSACVLVRGWGKA